MSDHDRPTDREADEQVPGETATGARPGGRDPASSPTPGGAVPGEVGTVHGDPQQADAAGDTDLGSDDGDHVREVAEKVRETESDLDEGR